MVKMRGSEEKSEQEHKQQAPVPGKPIKLSSD